MEQEINKGLLDTQDPLKEEEDPKVPFGCRIPRSVKDAIEHKANNSRNPKRTASDLAAEVLIREFPAKK